jgi:hypothetical protein
MIVREPAADEKANRRRQCLRRMSQCLGLHACLGAAPLAVFSFRRNDYDAPGRRRTVLRQGRCPLQYLD